MSQPLQSSILAVALLTGTALAQAANTATERRWQGADGVAVAASSRSFVRLSGDGASLTAITQTQGESPRLQLCYVGNRRAGHVDRIHDRRTPEWSADTARIRHDHVVETYRLTAHGFEQSFQVAQRPAGHGDWIFAIAIDGNVTADARPARHAAIEFSQDGHRAVRYGEAIAFDRSGQRVDVQTAYDGAGNLQLIVPAAFVDSASYPIVIDPVVTPVFIPSDTFFDDSQAAVAQDLTTDTYMVAWRRTFSTGGAGIYAKLFTATGTFASSVVAVVVGGNDIANPAVVTCTVFSPNAFLVVFEQNNRIRGRLMSTTLGTTLAPAFDISAPAFGQRDRRPAVSGPGTGTMMVAWDRTANGATEPSEIVLNHVFWLNANQPQNVSLGNEQILENVTSGNVKDVRLAASDVRTVVGGLTWYANRAVWSRFYSSPAPGDSDIRTASFRIRPPASFAIIDPVGGVPSGANVGPDEILPDIGGRASLHSSDGDIQYLIAWEDEGDVLAHMMDLDGVTGSLITIQDDPSYQGQPAVGAGYCEFSVGYLEIIPPAEFDAEIRAARVLLDGTVAVTDRLVDDPGTQAQLGLRASSRQIHTVSEDRTNRVLFAWTGLTGPASGINDIRAAYFEPVDANESPFGSPCPGPLGELPLISTAYGPAHAGNDDFEFRVTDAPATSLAVLVISSQLTTMPIPGAPGCSLYAGLPVLMILPTVTNAAGVGAVVLPIPCSIPSGAVLAFQWGVYSPNANAFGWIVSDDLDISWSHF